MRQIHEIIISGLSPQKEIFIMKKFIVCLAAFLMFAGCATNWNCRACKANSAQDKANAGTEKVLHEIDTPKTK
jgi:uncharacterized lipoprotein YajG